MIVTLYNSLFKPKVPGEQAALLDKPQWSGTPGVKGLMTLAVPLVLTNAAVAVNMFLDRMLLAWYSDEAFAAALQSGMLNWTVMVVFFQTVLYVGTFVAQYTGARADHRVGPVVWQGIYLSLIGGAILALIAPLGYPLFEFIGHEGELPRLEAEYFMIMTAGGVVFLVNAALMSFYTGRGKVKTILLVNVWAATLNFCLNVWMIFTPTWIFPAGIQGAAWATVFANLAAIGVYAALMWANPESEVRFRLWSGRFFEPGLLRRLFRFGFPAGVHNFVEMSGITTFMMVVGLFGFAAQYASNLAMNLNLVLFIPAVGMHSAASIRAGQLCGAEQKKLVERMTAGAVLVTGLYMLAVCYIYIGIPHVFLDWFRGGQSAAEWAELVRVTRILLVFVALFSLFDAFMLVYGGALKGAGDTHYVMWLSMIFCVVFLIIPCVTIALLRHHFPTQEIGLYVAWTVCSVYIIALAVLHALRFRTGRWKHIDVIHREETVITLEHIQKLAPALDSEEDSEEIIPAVEAPKPK